MSYYTFQEPADNAESKVFIYSEEDIRRNYYPYWLEKMYKKYGKAHVLANFTFDDCIEDWMCVNGAWRTQ